MASSIPVSVKVKGATQYRAALRRFPRDEQNQVDVDFGEIAFRRMQRAQTNAPFKTGAMRRGHRIRRERLMHYVVFIDPRLLYPKFVHEGTRFMRARPWLRNAFFGVERDIAKIPDRLEAILRRKYGAR